MSIDIKIEDNSKKFLDELEKRIPVALEECGLAAEVYAKKLCVVDTGLLRNSITHAVSGQPAAIDSYKSNGVHATTEVTKRAGTAGKPAPVVEGKYSGKAPEERGDKITVYLGTNVEYAPYVEMGTEKTKPQPFIKPAVANHQKEYKQILEYWLKK